MGIGTPAYTARVAGRKRSLTRPCALAARRGFEPLCLAAVRFRDGCNKPDSAISPNKETHLTQVSQVRG